MANASQLLGEYFGVHNRTFHLSNPGFIPGAHELDDSLVLDFFSTSEVGVNRLLNRGWVYSADKTASFIGLTQYELARTDNGCPYG